MKYIENKNKYVFHKDGVYFVMTLDQVEKMKNLCEEILSKSDKAQLTEKLKL